MKLEEDGVKHINVYSKGNTELGKFLSNFTKAPFVHPNHGNFNSIEGLWYWLSTKDNALRLLHGLQAKQYGRSIGGDDWIDEDDFKEQIKLGIEAKLGNYPLMLDAFEISTLPFKHYYVFGSKVVEPAEGKWIVDFLEELRTKFKYQTLMKGL